MHHMGLKESPDRATDKRKKKKGYVPHVVCCFELAFLISEIDFDHWVHSELWEQPRSPRSLGCTPEAGFSRAENRSERNIGKFIPITYVNIEDVEHRFFQLVNRQFTVQSREKESICPIFPFPKSGGRIKIGARRASATLAYTPRLPFTRPLMLFLSGIRGRAHNNPLLTPHAASHARSLRDRS